MKRLWPILLVVLWFGSACSLMKFPSLSPATSAPATEEASAPTQAAPPTAPPSPTPAGPAVLFQDDFSNPESGWDRVNAKDGITDYTDTGAYRIFVNVDNTDVWANPGLNFTDVRIEVDATKVGGPDDNDFGVICRYQGLDNFYFFIISSDGYYAIGKVQEGEQTLLSGENMEYSDAILQGMATNHLRADCVGPHLVLFVNGNKLAEARDDAFADGDVGLIAGTFDTKGTDILFDNFTVFQP